MNKSLRKLISLVCMGIILLELIFLLSDSMEITLLEERKNAYGEWQCAFCDITSEIIENLNANPLIQSVGIIHNSHSVYNEEGKEIGSLGTMDDAAIQLCRITCYEGRLPEQVHEIAMEALMMTRLGITSEIGDPVILYQYGSDGTLYEKTFTLTGILHNYETTSLLSEHTELPGILVSKADDTDDGIWSAVLLGRSRWKTMQEDLSSMDITNELISNTSTYLEDGVDTAGTMMEWLRLFIILLTFIVLLTVVLSFIHGRKDEWQQWFLLGAELHQIHLYLLEEAILTFLISTAIGLPASLCTFLLYQAISKKLLNNQLVLSFSISHLLLTLLVVAAALILTYAISMAGIGKYNTITDFHDSEKQQGMASRRKKTLSSCIRKHYQQISSTSMSKQSTFTALKPLTILEFWIREWLSGCYLSTFFLILFTAFLTILCLGIHGIQTEWKTLKALEKSYGSSYIFENIEQCDYLGNTASGVYPETLSELNQVMGIQSVESMYRMENALFWANLSSLAEDPYYFIYQSEKQIILQNSIMQDLEYGVNVNHVEKLQETYQMLENQKMMPLDVWGVDDGVFLEQIKENLDSGSIGTESFLNGDEAILILPAYRELQDDEGTYYYSYFGDIQEKSQDQFICSSVQPGISLTIVHNGQSESIRIAAVLHSLDSADRSAEMPHQAYTLIAGKAFLERYAIVNYNHLAQYVNIRTNRYADETTDKIILHTVRGSGIESTNYREVSAIQQREFTTTSGVWGIIMLTVFWLCIFIYSGLQRVEQHKKGKEWQLLWQLGMPESMLICRAVLNRLFLMICGILLNALLLSVWYTWQTNRIIKELGQRKAFAFRIGIDLRWYLLISIILLAVGFIACVIQQYKMIKNWKGDLSNDRL